MSDLITLGGLDICSFCNKKDDDEPFLENDDHTACICQSCALMFEEYMLDKKGNDSTKPEVDQDHKTEGFNKNDAFDEDLNQLQDKWMEKDIVSSYIRECGGQLELVSFHFEDVEDGYYYFVCTLEVEDIDSLPKDVEEKILNEIEWAFDDIRVGLAERGLDLESSLGEKLVLTRGDW